MRKKYCEPNIWLEEMNTCVMVESQHQSWDDENWGSDWNPWG